MKESATVNAAALVAACAFTKTNTCRTVLQCVNVCNHEDEIVIRSTDSVRLVHISQKATYADVDGFSANIPADLIKRVVKANKGPVTVETVPGIGLVSLTQDGTKGEAFMTESTYPNSWKLIPDEIIEPSPAVCFEARYLEDALTLVRKVLGKHASCTIEIGSDMKPCIVRAAGQGMTITIAVMPKRNE